MISALESVGGTLRDLASWRHFSTARRVEFLARCAREPELARRFLARLHKWSLAGVLLFLVAAGFEGARLAQDYGTDRLRAHLRLGEYAAAGARAAALEDLRPELRALVARARSIGHDVAEAGELETLARAALAHDDPQAALEYLQLGALRGRADLGEQALALAARLAPRACGAGARAARRRAASRPLRPRRRAPRGRRSGARRRSGTRTRPGPPRGRAGRTACGRGPGRRRARRPARDA